MTDPPTQRSSLRPARTAVLLGLAALGAGACGGDRPAAEARSALGTQLGAAHAAAGIGGTQAASADDLSAARRYLEATLRVDPNNDAARTALASLGGVAPDEVDVPFAHPDRILGPVASHATPGRALRAIPAVAFGEVGALGSDVAVAVAPWAGAGSGGTAPTTSAVPRTAADSAEALAALVGARTVAADSATHAQSARGAADRAATRTRAVSARRRGRRRQEATLAAREDSLSAADSTIADAGGAGRPKHKRTWPWTRAQRWLVAKGVGAGGGAGVIVGAIVGNVPGALIAGSLTGGAVGFKKATKIGPAAPYPTPSDSAKFDIEKREKEKADTTRRVATKP